MNRSRPWLLTLLPAILSVACDGGADPVQREPETPAAEGFEGLSPEQIRMQAESMSPEVAESLGIIDTTIHVEDRLSDDSLIPPAILSDTGR